MSNVGLINMRNRDKMLEGFVSHGEKIRTTF